MMVDWCSIKMEIIAFSHKIGLDKIGFTSGEPFYEIEEVLREHQEKGFTSGFEEKNIDLRIDPALSFPEVRSIISVALAYPSQEEPSNLDNIKPRGKFCRASWGQDYHLVLQEKLNKLSLFIATLVPWAKTVIMVDTGPLSDRAVAKRAGLGWIGKNNALITEEYGSFVYLGEVLTNLPLEPDQELSNKCGDCTKCISACPMHAIVKDKSYINCQKCLAFQTLTKGHLTPELKEKIARQNYLYGCDVCQLVCPYNQNKQNDWHQEFAPVPELINPVLEDIINISNAEFKNKFGFMSGSWRGKKNLQRNAILILGKAKLDEYIPLLKDIVNNDPRPEIRAAAAWSLGQYSSEKASAILQACLEKEKDEQVLQEIKTALNI
ncbi:MAG: tRNA epoxyqueuosine(34) reductase QueG [Peptococcales bacterium]|jgi:epoxyqueuosine reductase